MTIPPLMSGTPWTYADGEPVAVHRVSSRNVRTRVEVLDLDLERLERVPAGQPFITVRRVGLLLEATRWKDGKALLTARRPSRFGALRAIAAVTDPPWWVPAARTTL